MEPASSGGNRRRHETVTVRLDRNSRSKQHGYVAEQRYPNRLSP